MLNRVETVSTFFFFTNLALLLSLYMLRGNVEGNVMFMVVISFGTVWDEGYAMHIVDRKF